MAAMFKELLRLAVIAVPIALIARYALFSRAEFALFVSELKTYFLPFAAGLLVLAVGGVSYCVLNKVDHARQKQLYKAYNWISAILLVIAFIAVAVFVKLSAPEAT